MEQKLMVAARAGDIDSLYDVLEEDPFILEKIQHKPFTDTPLHKSAAYGHTHFALEIMHLKPSFGRKLNPMGLSPLEVCLRHRHTRTVQGLIKFHPELIRVGGRRRITPLHYVAREGQVDLLVEFLLTSPSSILDLTAKGETAFHVAVKNNQLLALKALLGTLLRTGHGDILNWKDEDGNNVLHIATSTYQSEVVDCLVKDEYLELNDLNKDGVTALDIAMTTPDEFSRVPNEQIRKTLKSVGARQASSLPIVVPEAEFLSSHPKHFESIYGLDIYLEYGLSGDMRNALLVVAALIATATYQTLLQPPGGFSQPNSKWALAKTSATMSPIYFYPIIGLNTMAFVFSMGIILLLLPFSRFNTLLRASLFFFVYDYILLLAVISKPDEEGVVTICFLVLFIFIFFTISPGLIARGRYAGLRSSSNIRATRSIFIKYWRAVAIEKANLDNMEYNPVA